MKSIGVVLDVVDLLIRKPVSHFPQKCEEELKARNVLLCGRNKGLIQEPTAENGKTGCFGA